MFDVIGKDSKSRARLGLLKTGHGAVETPAYVIVGTRAAVRCLEPEDIPKTKTQIIIANTYHLWRGMSDEELNNYPGLHEVMGWNGAIMTDSGGFQVFSLGASREHGVRWMIERYLIDDEMIDRSCGYINSLVHPRCKQPESWRIAARKF